MMPAPSPISGSAPTAPRCSRFSRMARPFLTILWLARFLRSTMKPTPHASCSRTGSNRPKASGRLALRMARSEAGGVPFLVCAICSCPFLSRQFNPASRGPSFRRAFRPGRTSYGSCRSAPFNSVGSGTASKWPLVRAVHPASRFRFRQAGQPVRRVDQSGETGDPLFKTASLSYRDENDRFSKAEQAGLWQIHDGVCRAMISIKPIGRGPRISPAS